MKIKNIALTASLVSFAIGFSELQENVVFWLGRPLGAVFFIIYFLAQLLEKEVALLDEQEAAQLAGAKETADCTKGCCGKGCRSSADSGSLQAAVSH